MFEPILFKRGLFYLSICMAICLTFWLQRHSCTFYNFFAKQIYLQGEPFSSYTIPYHTIPYHTIPFLAPTGAIIVMMKGSQNRDTYLCQSISKTKILSKKCIKNCFLKDTKRDQVASEQAETPINIEVGC